MLGARSCFLVWVGVGLIAASSASDPTPKKWGCKETTVDELGPEDWKLGFPNCGGTHQSPIDIPTHDISDMVFWGDSHPPLRYGGKCEKFTLKKLEDLYKWEIDPNEHCTVTSDNNNGREYSLLQFHMHSTSEHTKDGEHFDAEIHFVHKAVDGSGALLVMGVFVQAQEYADPNDFIESLWSDMESGDKTFDLQESNTNYADLLNSLVAKSHLVNYSGSLTTPECNEIVDWWLLSTPITITYEDLFKLKRLYAELPATSDDASDNRPTQPLNGRQIKFYYHQSEEPQNPQQQTYPGEPQKHTRLRRCCCTEEIIEEPEILAEPF